MAPKRGYSIRNVGKKGLPKYELPHTKKAGKAAMGGKHSFAHASTNVYSKVPGIRVRRIDYQQAGMRDRSGNIIVGTTPFVNLGKGKQGRGLLSTLKTRRHLGIKPAKGTGYGGRHRA